ncbi:MAG: hypothetical protein QM817_30955 [Archangium sp.]
MIEPMLSAQQPNDASAKPAPAWVAVGSALLMVGPMPFALALLFFLLRRGGLSGLAEMFVEGGGFSYGVLLAGIVATIASAVVAFLGARRGTFPATASGLVWLLVLLVSFLGAKSSLDAVMAAMSAVSPADRATILAGSISELLSLQLLASSVCLMACLSVALGQGLAVLGGPNRLAAMLGALGFLALTVSMGGSLLTAVELREGFRAVAMVSPDQKAEVLFQVALEASRFDRFGALGTLAAIGLAVVGGVVVAQRERRAGILAAAALLVTAVGFRGVLLLTERTLSSADLNSVLATTDPLVRLAGLSRPEGYGYPQYLSGRSCAEIAEAIDRHADIEMGGPNSSLGIALEASLTREQLLCAFSAAHARGYSAVILVGAGPPRVMPKDFPALLRPFFALFADTESYAPVKLHFDDETKPVDVATLISGGVELARVDQPVKTFSPPQSPSPFTLIDLAPARCEWKSDIASLANGAAAAAANGSLLTLVVERPASEN